MFHIEIKQSLHFVVLEKGWIEFESGISERPECEVVGQDGSKKIYAFKGYYNGYIIPGKADHKAYISFGGEEINLDLGTVLLKGNYEWIFGKNGSVPPNAVLMSTTPDGSPLYLGRAFINGTLTPGKIPPKHGCLYIPYHGTEHKVTTYTVLCHKDVLCPPTWCPIQRSETQWVDFRAGVSERPECEVVGQDGVKKIYAFRAYYKDALTPGKADHKAYISYGDEEITMSSGKLLRKGNYEWIFGKNGSVPPHAVVMGHAANGNPFYMGRAFFKDTLTPGKIYPQHECLYIPYHGVEHKVKIYTVLCYKHVQCPNPTVS